MISLIEQLTYWHWGILAAALLILEMLAPGVVFLWIAIAAGIMGAATLMISDFAWQWQLTAFSILSVVSVIVGRKYLVIHSIGSDHPMLNERGEQAIGRVVTLTEPIVNGVGKARMGDTDWRVIGADRAAGAAVRVTGIDGSTLTVEPVE